MIDGWLEDLKPGYTIEKECEMQEYATAQYHRLYLNLKKIDDRFFFMRTSCYLRFKDNEDRSTSFYPIIISWSSKWARLQTKAEFDSKTGKIRDFNAAHDAQNLFDWATTKEIRKDWKELINLSCQRVYDACCEAIRLEKENIKLAKQREIREAAAQYD